MPINFDLVEPAILTGFIRELPGPAQYTLNTWLQDQMIGDIEAGFQTLYTRNRAAVFRAYDAETPIGPRDNWERSRVALPPLGIQSLLGEEERLKLEMLRSGGDNTAGLINAIYQDAAANTSAVLARMEMLRGQVLSTGKVTISENRLVVEADYGVPGDHLVTAGTLWSDLATSDPLEDLRDWADKYTDDAGEAPAYALTSRKVIGLLLRNEKVRGAFATSAGFLPPSVTRAQLASLLASLDLPQLVEYNTSVFPYGSSTAARIIPESKVILLPSNPADLGKTFWGITAEAMELVGLNNPQLTFSQAPGLVGTVFKTENPVRTWTNVAAIGMPVITDPLKLFVATVTA